MSAGAITGGFIVIWAQVEWPSRLGMFRSNNSLDYGVHLGVCAVRSE